MTRAQSICLVLAIAVAPLLSSCSAKTFPSAATLPATVPIAGMVARKKATLTGTWGGDWYSGSHSGTFSMHLTQKRKKFSGSVSIILNGHKTSGSIQGTIAKKTGKLSLTITAKGESGTGTATVNKGRTTINGSVRFGNTSSTFSGTKE